MLIVILYNGDKVIVFKYHGCGNSFLIINKEKDIDYPWLSKRLCNVIDGIGSDGLIVAGINPLSMRIFNKDGSEASMCGNGIRCFVHYLLDQGLIEEDFLKIYTLAGEIEVKVISPNPFICDVNLGKPKFRIENEPTTVSTEDKPFDLYSIWLGTEHGVVFVDSFALLEEKPRKHNSPSNPFRNRYQCKFSAFLNSENALVKTYERGVGWTPSCGTGAGACFAIAQKFAKCQQFLRILYPYGILTYYVDSSDSIHLVGPSQKVAKIFLEKRIEK